MNMHCLNYALGCEVQVMIGYSVPVILGHRSHIHELKVPGTQIQNKLLLD